MNFFSLEPFVPSGADFEQSKQLFLELGFHSTWNGNGYAGFEKDGCRFILQHFDQPAFAENFMISVKLSDAAAFRAMVLEKQLPARFGIRVSEVREQPYGKEVNLIDIAGVCWHFVEG